MHIFEEVTPVEVQGLLQGGEIGRVFQASGEGVYIQPEIAAGVDTDSEVGDVEVIRADYP